MKKETLQRNLPVILAISLPIALVLFVALLAFIPNLGPKPQYDFLFTQNQTRSRYLPNGSCEVYKNYYTIEQQQLIIKPFEVSVFDSKNVSEPCAGFSSIIKKDSPELYIYRMNEEKSEEISFENAQKLVLKGTLTSPDGFSVQKRMINNGGILDIFGGQSEGGVFASKKNSYIKLNFPEQENSYYDRDFNFVSWVSQS